MNGLGSVCLLGASICASILSTVDAQPKIGHKAPVPPTSSTRGRKLWGVDVPELSNAAAAFTAIGPKYSPLHLPVQLLPIPKGLDVLATDMVSYMDVHYAYQDWIRGWFPEVGKSNSYATTSDGWIASGSDKAFDKFVDHCDQLVETLGPAVFPVPKIFFDAGLCSPVTLLVSNLTAISDCITTNIPVGTLLPLIVVTPYGLPPSALPMDLCTDMRYTTFKEKHLKALKHPQNPHYIIDFEITSIIEAAYRISLTFTFTYNNVVFQVVADFRGIASFSGVPNEVTADLRPLHTKQHAICFAHANVDAGLTTSCPSELANIALYVSCDATGLPSGCTKICPASPSIPFCDIVLPIVLKCICTDVQSILAGYKLTLTPALQNSVNTKLPVCYQK